MALLTPIFVNLKDFSVPSMLSKFKNRKVAVALAFAGMVMPVSGLHKFYLGQPIWGVLYLLLSWTPIPKVASVIEGVWYLAQNQDDFDQNFNSALALGTVAVQSPGVDPAQVGAIADALRQLDTLRQDGLISEYEFEQKRRQLLDRIA
nr:NINE protein [Leptolyngbya sp. FACHB-671]